MDAVATFTARGPMADMAMWTLGGDDAGDFMPRAVPAMSVMLMFSSSPDFENPADADTDNIYMVTLKANDGGRTRAPTTSTVTVTDADEDGTVALEPDMPMVGMAVTATLTTPTAA